MSYIALSDFGRNNITTLGNLNVSAATVSSIRVTSLISGNVIADSSGNLIIGAGGGSGSIIAGPINTALLSDGVSAIWLQIVDGYISPTAAIQGTKIQSATTSSLGVIKLAQDLGGTALLPQVLKINGASVPTIGAIGNALQVTGAGTLGYGPINLAGGANFVTGVLPIGAFAPGSANQVFTTNGSGATAWALITNANVQTSAAISVSKLAAGTNSDVLTTVAGVPSWTTISGGGSPVGSNRLINTTLPLTGGGNLTNNLTLAINNATAGAVGVIQLAGDLGIPATAPIVVGLTGSGGNIAVHASNFLWDVAVASPQITQTLSGASTGSTMAIVAQSATTTGGHLILSSGSATTAGEVRLAIGGGSAFVVNTASKYTLFSSHPTWTTGTITPVSAEIDGSIYTETGSPNGDLWVRRNGAWVSIMGLAGGSTPTGPAGGIDVTGTFPNALTVIGLTGVGAFTIIRSTSPVLQFQNTTIGPTINQGVTSVAPGQLLTIQAQNTTAAGQPGGSLTLTSGTGGAGSFPGSVSLSTGGTAQFSVLTNPTVLQMVPALLQWAAATASPSLTQVSQGSGNANVMTVQAQSAIGSGTPTGGNLQLFAGNSTNGTGGNLVLRTGSGAAGAVGNMLFSAGSTTAMTLQNGGGTLFFNTVQNIQWANSTLNPSITQVTLPSGTATNITINAQSSSSGAGGGLILSVGTGTTTGGNTTISTGLGSGVTTGSILLNFGSTNVFIIRKNGGQYEHRFAGGLSGSPPFSFGMDPQTGGNPGAIMEIIGQDGNGGSPGGLLNIRSGAGAGGASPGALLLQLGAGNGSSTTTMLALTHPSGSGRILGLLTSASGVEMPANTGDKVIFIANVATAPTTGIPVGGGILFVDGGALKFVGSLGTYTTIAPA